MRPFSVSLFSASATIFLLSTLVGVWAAGDIEVAWARLGLFAVAICLFVVIAVTTQQNRTHYASHALWPGGATVVATFAAALLAVGCFVFRLVTREVAAAALVVLLPVAAGELMVRGQAQNRMMRWLPYFALLIALLGFAMARERSAWLSLVAGCAVALLCHRYFGRAGDSTQVEERARAEGGVRRQVPRRLIITGVLVALAALLLFIATPLNSYLVNLLLDSTPYSRFYIWRDSLALLQDYRFTGSGLGQTAMVLSTYVYLSHVPFLFQTYNLLIQIGIEQGLPGIIGFAGITIAALLNVLATYRHTSPVVRWQCTATLATLIALVMHGSMDATLYVSALMPLTFLPFAIAMSLPIPVQARQSFAASQLVRSKRLLGMLIPAWALIGLFVPANSWAAWHANLGAVEQSRLELRVYTWPDWFVQDELRRGAALDLSGAEAHFEMALRMNPQNVSARRRLGQIALSRGNYDVAGEHLQVAYRLAPDARVTRQLLGELYAVTGDVRHAVDVWQAGDTDPHKLELRESWYDYLGATQQARWLHEAVAQYKATQASSL